MKKIIISVLASILVLGGIIMAASCGNKDIFDTVYTYDRAQLQMPDGSVIEGKVQNWTDYEDGDQIQVKINGKIYLVHSTNIVLIVD